MSYISKGVDLSKYEKYEKKKEVELASERVELGIIDDADAFISKANDKSLEADKYVQLAAKSYSEAAQLSAQAESILERALPQAKELGAKQLVKEIQSFIKGTSNRIKRYNKNEDSLKKIN